VFTVTNTGSVSVTVPLLGRTPMADFRVFDDADRLIWSHLRGEVMLGALALRLFGAGEQISFRVVWDQRDDEGQVVGAGRYLVRGVVLNDSTGLVSPAASTRIEDR
jgi:hypothetical protein